MHPAKGGHQSGGEGGERHEQAPGGTRSGGEGRERHITMILFTREVPVCIYFKGRVGALGVHPNTSQSAKLMGTNPVN
jgi:hypothetical protein